MSVRTYPNLAQITDPDVKRTVRIVYDLIRASEETIALQTKALVGLDARVTKVEPRVSSLESPQTFATSLGLSPKFVVRGISSDLVLTSGSIPRFKKIGDLLPSATRVRLEHSVSQSIPDATDTPLTWDTEVYDPKLLHDAASPTLITIATLGTYVGGVYVAWASDVVGERVVSIERNQDSALTLARDRRPAIGETETHLVLPDVQLAVGDTLRVSVSQNSGSPGGLNITTAAGSPVFWLRKIA